MLDSVPSRRERFIGTLRFMAGGAIPFYLTFFVIPPWVLTRLSGNPEPSWRAAAPALLIPLLVASTWLVQRLRPQSDYTLGAFCGAVGAASAVAVFAVWLIAQF